MKKFKSLYTLFMVLLNLYFILFFIPTFSQAQVIGGAGAQKPISFSVSTEPVYEYFIFWAEANGSLSTNGFNLSLIHI